MSADISHNCTFAVYVQMTPVTAVSPLDLSEHEAEDRRPTGLSVVEVPEPSLRVVMHSANCGLLLETPQEVKGLRMDVFWAKALNYGLALAVVLAIQTVLLVEQMEHSSTPSAVARVSWATVSLQVVRRTLPRLN